MADFYAYILFDWLGIPRYVGKGCGKRDEQHERTGSSNWLKDEFIAQTWEMLGEIPKTRVRENLTEADAFETEIALIAAIGRMNRDTGPLTNMTDGGEGIAGCRRVITDEHRQRLSAAAKRRITRDPEEWARTQKLSSGGSTDAAKEKNRLAHLGRQASAETKEKIRAALLGHPCSEETRRKISEENKTRLLKPGYIHPRKGITTSEETRHLISSANLGRKRTDEARARMRAARLRYLDVKNG